jgi:hypothetical protein
MRRLLSVEIELFLFFRWQGSRAAGQVAGLVLQAHLDSSYSCPRLFPVCHCLPMYCHSQSGQLQFGQLRRERENKNKNDTLPPLPKGQVHNVNVNGCYVVIQLVVSLL